MQNLRWGMAYMQQYRKEAWRFLLAVQMPRNQQLHANLFKKARKRTLWRRLDSGSHVLSVCK